MSGPVGVFVAADDTVYVAARGLNQVQMWPNGSVAPARTFNTTGLAPNDVFVTSSGDIHADNGNAEQSVQKYTSNDPSGTVAMNVHAGCFGVFVDIYGDLYCSSDPFHQVFKHSFTDAPNSSTVVAGTGSRGSASDMLAGPRGIFVDLDLRLFVADCYNNRIQRISFGQSNGVTVAGNGLTGTIVLASPTDVVLDADGRLFIVEFTNHRVIASRPHGFVCVIGCTGTSGSGSNQFNQPHSLSFDSVGNLYVADFSNNRVQKFLLANNSCGKYVKCLSESRNSF